jgi:hypothetical protein
MVEPEMAAPEMVGQEVVEPEVVEPEVVEPDWMRELVFWNSRRSGGRYKREEPQTEGVDDSCSVCRLCDETSPRCIAGLHFVEPTKRTVPDYSTSRKR